MLAPVVTLQLFVTAVLTGALDRARTQEGDRGIVSVEYIVLGAAIIAIVGFLATNGAVQQALATAFQNLFTEASA